MTRARAGWSLMTLLALGVAAYALGNALWPDMRTPFVAALFSEKTLRAFGHLAAGGIALATGAFQFSSALRAGKPGLHRVLGRIYLTAVFISGLSALLLAPVSAGGPAAHFGFGLLGALWVFTAFVAFERARAGDYASHRAWMIRSYALCLAAVTLRVYLPLGLGPLGVPFEQAYPAIAWLCWVPNLILAEWLLVAPSASGVQSGSTA